VFLNSPAVIVVVVVTVLSSLRGFRDARFAMNHVCDVEAVTRRGEWHRLITSGFLHANLPHLAFNMFSFYSFGSILEYVLGALRMLAVYFASMLGGNLLALALHRNETYRALGASGGVSGVIFAAVFLFPGGSVYVFPIPIAIPSWLFAIGFVVVSFVAMRRRADNIGHDAHLGGALCGLAVATLLVPSLPSRSPALFVAMIALTVGLIWYARVVPAARDPWNRDVAERLRRRWEQDGGVAGGLDDRERRRLDDLLAKISAEGIEALSHRERDELERLSRRRRGAE